MFYVVKEMFDNARKIRGLHSDGWIFQNWGRIIRGMVFDWHSDGRFYGGSGFLLLPHSSAYENKESIQYMMIKICPSNTFDSFIGLQTAESGKLRS